MIKHENVVGYLPLFRKLDIIYAKEDGKGGFYRQPAIAMAIVKDDENPAITFLVPMVAMKEQMEIDLAHGSNIIGYDDGSRKRKTDWREAAEKYEASQSKTGEVKKEPE